MKQSDKYTILLLKVLFLAFLLTGLGIVIYLWYVSYDQFIDHVVNIFDKEDKRQAFSQSLIKPERFSYLRLFFTIIVTGIFLFSIRIWNGTHFAAHKINAFFYILREKIRDSRQLLNSLSLFEKILVIITLFIIIIHRFVFASYYPLTVDEAFSYIFFVNEGPLVISTYYPGPNNHILYNQTAYLTNIFLSDPVWVMKLPVILISVVTSYLLFTLVLRNFNFWIAYLTLVFFSFSENMSYYSINGRGYMLQIFFMLLLIISMINIIREKDLPFYNVLFVISGTLGFYTIPTFLYPFVSILFFGITFGFLTRGVHPGWLLLNTLLVGLATLFLYTPVFLVNGISAVTSNPWVLPKPFFQYMQEFPSYLLATADWLINVEDIGWVILSGLFLCGILLLSYYLKNINAAFWNGLFISTMVVPIVMLLIHRVFPYYRVWSYFTVFQYLYLAIIVWSVLKFVSKERRAIVRLAGVAISVIFISYNSFAMTGQVKRGFGVYDYVHRVSREIFESGATNVFINEDVYNIFTRYEYAIRDYNINVDVNDFDKDVKYDIIVVSKESVGQYPIDYNMYNEKSLDDPYVIVFERKR